MTSWNTELFIGCKSSVAAQKKEFHAAGQRDCAEETGLRAEHSVAPGLFLRNNRENILGCSSVLSHCIFALTENTHLPSFLFYLPWLSFKSVIGSIESVAETPAMKGSFGDL